MRLEVYRTSTHCRLDHQKPELIISWCSLSSLCRCASVSQQHPGAEAPCPVPPSATGPSSSPTHPTGSGQRHGGDPHMTSLTPHPPQKNHPNKWLDDSSIRQTQRQTRKSFWVMLQTCTSVCVWLTHKRLFHTLMFTFTFIQTLQPVWSLYTFPSFLHWITVYHHLKKTLKSVVKCRSALSHLSICRVFFLHVGVKWSGDWNLKM